MLSPTSFISQLGAFAFLLIGAWTASACLTPDFQFGSRENISSSADKESRIVEPAEVEEVSSSQGNTSSGSAQDDNNATEESVVEPELFHCLNREVDKDEADVDCGGLDCDPCKDGQKCSLNSDCSGGECDMGTCLTPSCVDEKKNGAETDVDCGGGCTACLAEAACLENGDCVSQLCEARSCLAASCSDNVKNGTETDIDCGGDNCSPCEYNQGCELDSDCIATSDENGLSVCQEGICSVGCLEGFEDCSLDGVCRNINDGQRCGGCLEADQLSGVGIACESRENAQSACSSGACAYSCQGGYRDTNNDLNLSSGDGCNFKITPCAAAWNGTKRNYSYNSKYSDNNFNWKCNKSTTSYCGACRPGASSCPWGNDTWINKQECYPH